MTSYALKGFLSRRHSNDASIVRAVGTSIGYSIVNLSTLHASGIVLDKGTIKKFTEIASLIKESLDALLSKQNSVVSQLIDKFVQSNTTIKIVWVEEHSSLVELLEDSIPSFARSLVRPNGDNEKIATFFVDISFFMNATDVIEQNRLLISLLYRLGFVRGVSRLFNLSDKESFHLTLSLLDREDSMKITVADFLDLNGSVLQLDHDKSLSHCLREFEASTRNLPIHLRFKNVFDLETLLATEKDKSLRNAIKTCLLKRDRQVILLIKQMDISLPYPRQEFQKAYQHVDIKMRRELCFQLIKNFDRKLESLNIAAVVARLRDSFKYSINQPKFVVGRESRAFGNQAYLFANSKLIEVDTEMQEITNELRCLCTTEHLKQIIEKEVETVQSADLSEIMSQFMVKFGTCMFELVPSIGRLVTLVFNTTKSSSFTQYNGAFQNLRESLEILFRKSTSIVEKQRKMFIEDYFESTTRSNSSRNTHFQSFFTTILQALCSFAGKSGAVEKLILKIEEKVYSLYSSSTGSVRAAYSVLLQRPSFAGSERFKLNELETKPEQEESLQKLVTVGGDHLYMSPSYEWIAEATDLIEAVPLFIYERTIVVNEKPTTVFEVDQEGLEQTIRQIAEYWAQNIELTIESEHISLARSILVRLSPELNELSTKIETADGSIALNKEICELMALESLIQNGAVTQKELAIKIAKLSELIGSMYNELCVQVEAEVEKAWSLKEFLTRSEALERILIDKNLICLKMVDDACRAEITKETSRLSLRAFERQRPLPAFHLLTTEAPGLVEGFITVVLEEEMAMRNVIKSFGLEDEVKRQCSVANTKLSLIAERVISEFGYEPIVFQNTTNGLSKEQSLLRVMSENIPIEEEVAKLSILVQMYYFEKNDSKKNISLPFTAVDIDVLDKVEAYWLSKCDLDTESIKQQVFKQVLDKNKENYDFNEALQKYTSQSSHVDLSNEFLTSHPIYSQEVEATKKWIQRWHSFDYVCNKYPNLHLKQRAKSFIREHTSLIQTTCRRHVISQNELHSQLCHPRYAFSSGVTFDENYTSTPTGLRKRYHLIYAPSRVNLGKDERRSVENWSQFLGVSDSLAARHAQTVYEMINYSPVIRNIREAENLKVSENQWTALVRSVRNVHAFFVERLGVGDIEDLSYQFNQRGGLNFGSLKESEGYNSGPTAGYCIPKDLLFKLFVGTHQDSRKLLQIGVPTFLHQHLISLMIEVYSHRNRFSTIGEWELWAADQFLNKESLSKRFSQCTETEVAHHISSYLQNYITMSGSKIVFHLTKLIQILGNTGVPSPLLSTSRDLHSVLWSNWSDHKITLGGEQVNRSTVFTLTREIPESARRSRLMNPKAGISQDDALRIVMNGVYKGDDDELPPPDVRYSWTMRAFQIMSGHYQAVADSLDLEGQIIARLSWVGFKPESKDPKDVEAAEYLLKKFNGDSTEAEEKLVSRLRKAFPCHSTVGDITITAVHGVDSEDLLGFSAETLTLLGDEADKAKHILETHGHMSVDQMKANAVLRRKFPEEWTPLNSLSQSEQQNIKELVGASYHPLVLRLRGPGTNLLSDLQGQDVVVFSITHPEILKLDPSHLRDLMLVGRPNSALCVLDYVAQGRHRCWFERDVMLWYAASNGLSIKGHLCLDWSKRNARHSVYKAFGTGIEQYSPSLGTDLRSEVARQEKRAIDIWNAARDVVRGEQSIQKYQAVLSHYLSNGVLLTETLLYQQQSQKLLMSKRFKPRDKIIQECIQRLSTTAKHRLSSEFTPVDWLSIGGMFLINGTPKCHQNEILDVIRKVSKEINPGEEELIAHLIVPQLKPTTMTLGEKKGEMFSVKASEDSQNRAVTRRAQLSIQADLQLSMKHRSKGFEMVKQRETESSLASIFNESRRILLELSCTPAEGVYSVEMVNEKFGLLIKYTVIALEIITNKVISQEHMSKEDVHLKNSITASINKIYSNGTVDLKVLDTFCGTYEDHGYLSKLLEHSKQVQSESVDEILGVCELLYDLLALEKTSQFLTTHFSTDNSSNFWRKLSEFFAKTIDDHFYEYNPWILDSKRGSAFLHFYDDLGIVKRDHKQALYSTSWKHHRLLYKYFYNLITNHSDFLIKVPTETDRQLLIGSVVLSEKEDGVDDIVGVTSIGNTGVGEEEEIEPGGTNYESLWRSYNQLRELAFMRNDGFEFPVVFKSLDSTFAAGLNSNKKINLAILSPVGRTHYSRAIMESSFLNDNVFITRTGFFSNDGKTKLKGGISRENTYLFIKDAHFYLDEKQYHSSLKQHYGMSDLEASKQVEIDNKLGRFSGKGIRVAATFKEPVLIGCCIAHHHHPLEIGLTEAGYPATDKSPFLFDLTYNKSLYPVMYSSSSALLPPQIDWFKEETSFHLEEQMTKHGKSYQQAEDFVVQLIRERLRPFALEHGIIIAKGAAESGARNLSRFDIRNLGMEASGLIDENVLLEASKFIYVVSKGQNVTIQRAIVSTPLSWMSQYAVKKFLDRQIIEHGVSVNVDKYPKDFIYGTLRVIFSSSVPNLNDLHNPSNWEPSHLISLSSLQMATNVGRQGTLEILCHEMIHAKFRDTFIDKLTAAGKKAMCLTSLFGSRYWNDEVLLYGSENADAQKIAPYKERNPGLPEKDAADIPYWWPRYLMLDLIPEALFVDNEGKEIVGCHIIDIKTTQTSDGSYQSIYLVRDKNGRVCEGKIYDFLFWLLEPNVGIGLWPNYWKREIVRCQETIEGEIDYQQVGISDRIVLNNFLKAGNEFMKIKNKLMREEGVNADETITTTQSSRSDASPSVKSTSAALNEALSGVALKHGLISIGESQVSMWLSEALRHTIILDQLEPEQLFEDLLQKIKSITSDEIDCSREILINKGSLIPSIKANSRDIVNWLLNETYVKRVCETVIDSILSQPLAPRLEILPRAIKNTQSLLPHSETFVVISNKTSLLTHHIYPFICGRGDYPINVVGVHSSWIMAKSNLAKRAIFYNPLNHCFIEGDLEKPLILDYGFVVELCVDGEVLMHEKLTQEYESAGMTVINHSSVSRERADDKIWIRENTGVVVPRYIILSHERETSDEQLIQPFLSSCERGVVVQPSKNTTESTLVQWFDSSSDINIISDAARRIQEAVNTSVLISEFSGNVSYKGSPVVFRFNVSISQISVAAYVGSSRDSKIVGLGSDLKGYCERLDVVLKELYDETNKIKVSMSNKAWSNLLAMARTVAHSVGLPLVGIDLLLESSNDGTIRGVVLEVNARPGTLIFGEELIFDESGRSFHSSMVAPVNEDFWNLITQTSLPKLQPQTLLQWKQYISSSSVNELSDWLLKRYGADDSSLIVDRIRCIRDTIDDCIMTGKFDLSQSVSIIFSNGRDRYFGGHTDFLGLGGPTINSTSKNEIISIIQVSKDSSIHVSNSNKEFKSSCFDIEKILNDLSAFKKMGQEIWDPNEWTSYLKATIAYMLSSSFSRHEQVRASIFNNNTWTGCRIHFNSAGRLELLPKVGASSSAALTSSFVLGLNKIFNMRLSRIEMSETDFGEYYLGKTAGSADKTSILNAQNGKLIAQSSFPDRIMQLLSLPNQVVVIMANSNIPRLNSLNGRKYLASQNLYTAEKIDAIVNWSQGVMRRFGSYVFVQSTETIIKCLKDEKVYSTVGINDEEACAVLKSFGDKPLLKELCFGGGIEKNLASHAGWANRHKRYKLIFKILRLLPESLNATIGGHDDVIHPRKSSLYGISEVERCHGYLCIINKMNGTNEDKHLVRLLDLVRWAHDGDRAAVDYRKDFKATAWASDKGNLVSDEILDAWISNEKEELVNKPGGFERSLPEFDEWANSLDETFKRQAALRVSAAGLGGTMCVHSVSSIASDVIYWLKQKGFSVRTVRPGPSFDIL